MQGAYAHMSQHDLAQLRAALSDKTNDWNHEARTNNFTYGVYVEAAGGTGCRKQGYFVQPEEMGLCRGQ